LINAHIGTYKYAPQDGYDPTHSRKLLLNQAEINGLLGKEKGLTIVPLELYVGSRGLIKLKIGLGRGRKKHDKREHIKKRDTSKEIRQATR
jgi:SsrA-binding protein